MGKRWMGVCTAAVVLAAVGAAVPAASAGAQETAYGHIVLLQTGSLGGPASALNITTHFLADDTASVTLDVPFVNAEDRAAGSRISVPGTPCKNTQGSYALDPKDPGVKLNESVLLSAFMAGRRVRLTLNGCVFNKPRIISVSLSSSAS